MKTSAALSILLSLILLPLAVHGVGKRGALWKGVEAAAEEGLPKTAIEKLGAIIGESLKDKAYPEAINAIVRKIEFEVQITEGDDGGEDHASRGGDREGAKGNGAGDGGDPRGLVLALFLGQSRALPRTHGDGGGAGEGHRDVGSAAPVCGD